MIAFAAPASANAPGLFLPRILREAFRREPLYAGAATMLAIAMLPTLVAYALDDRLVGGVAAWAKPLKFEASLAIYLFTLAWFAGWLPAGFVQRRPHRLMSCAVVAAVALEMAWIVGAAAHGVASHFNVESQAMVNIYRAMGALAVLLTSASAVLGVAILRARDAGGDPALRLAIGLGLVLTVVLTLPAAGYLSSGAGHLVGVEAEGVRRLAILGWARNGGDLRVAHFLATHAMHAIPLAGWIASRLLAPGAARMAVTLSSLAYAMLVAWTFAEALAGRPFLPFLD
jgi:hypothetical protein